MGRAVLKNQHPSNASGTARAWRPYLTDAIVNKRWPLPVLAGLTGLLLSLIFAPNNIWPLAYVCLVPWLIGVVCSQRRFTMFVSSYIVGAIYFHFSLNWLWPVTVWPPEGIFGIQLPIGTLLLAMYLGLYWPVAAWLIRFAYKRMRAPLALAVPIVWTATEFIRGYLPVVPYDAHWQYTGLQWFFLGHSHYNVLPVIQIADLAGAYGVSFLIAAVNGWLTELLVHPQVWSLPKRWTRRQKAVTAGIALAVAGTLTYGLVQLFRDTMQPGPQIAIIQTDEPLFVETGGFNTPLGTLNRNLWNLIDQAVHSQPKPDIVVLPETMWPWKLNREFREMVVPESEITPHIRNEMNEQILARRDHERLRKTAEEFDVTIVVGTLSLERHFDRPTFKTEKFNSVLVYAPGQDEPWRYDKIHLVLFGEFIPFRRGHLHRFYNYLNGLMPWTEEYSLTAGTEHKVFSARAASQGGRIYQFSSPICYEVTMSDACRHFSYGSVGKRADLLINLSNDGWFHYRAELPQHLAIAVFRAVENRVGLVRSVNTGISAAIDPKGHILKQMLNEDGQWREPAAPGIVPSRMRRPSLPYRGLSGVLSAQVPVDPSITLYMRWGNWLPIGCMCAAAVLLLAWWVDRTWIAVRHIRRHGHGNG